ncbi:SPT2-domain-containing protein [Backusella circina FSU 941]|nr:SPT2-domain-containing protein [Backusella circina FSU 941]
MAQATQVAKQQDAALMERARQKLREEEDRRKREARAAREKEAAEHERRLQQQQQQQQKKKASVGQAKRQTSSKMSDPTERKRNQSTAATTTAKGRNVNSSKRFPSASHSASSFLPEKKVKHVDMSFEDLMRAAKEQSLNKSSSVEKPTPNKSRSVEKPRESLYHKQPQRKPTSTPSSLSDHQLTVRERAKLLGPEAPKRVSNINTKKDRRSISEIQREIRHSKGIHSDEEEGGRKDSRLMSTKNKQPQRYQHNTSPLPRKRQLSPPPRQSQAPMKRSSIPPSRAAGPRRMPFSGRPMDGSGRRGGPSQQQMNRRRYREEEEEDEEMDDFVVDDEEDYDIHSRNGYSDEISKIFRYDKNRYANEPVYSDEDMEANASDVLREEKRSERIARREDLIEEQKEMERLQKKKKRS